MNESKIDQIPRDCFIQLKAVYDTLKRAERKAADYLLEHPQKISSLNIVDYADRAGCSEATIVRFSKRLGYEGFPELKSSFDASGTNGNAVEYKDISAEDQPVTVMQKVFDASASALHDTMRTIDPDAYQRSVDLLCRAGTVMFCGTGDAGVVATEAYQRWIRMGESCVVASDHDIQLILASRLTKGDLLVAISHTGRTRTVVNVASQAKLSGASIVAITNFPISPLAKKSDVVLQTAVFSRYPSGEVMSKRVTQLCIVESLSINVLLRKGEDSVRTLLKSNEVVGINKM